MLGGEDGRRGEDHRASDERSGEGREGREGFRIFLKMMLFTAVFFIKKSAMKFINWKFFRFYRFGIFQKMPQNSYEEGRNN